MSRFELLQQLTSGVPTDALLFALPAPADPAAGQAGTFKKRLGFRRAGSGGPGELFAFRLDGSLWTW